MSLSPEQSSHDFEENGNVCKNQTINYFWNTHDFILFITWVPLLLIKIQLSVVSYVFSHCLSIKGHVTHQPKEYPEVLKAEPRRPGPGRHLRISAMGHSLWFNTNVLTSKTLRWFRPNAVWREKYIAKGNLRSPAKIPYCNLLLVIHLISTLTEANGYRER